MEIKNQENDASLGEFMKVSLEGFSWAENIYQRVESICSENNMVQNPVKYVDVVGEHFRKVIDTVVSDLCGHADDVLELFSELSFGHASLVKASGKEDEKLDVHSSHDKLSTCICKNTAFMENLSSEHYNEPGVMENLGPGFKRRDALDETFLTGGMLDGTSSVNDSVLEHGDGAVEHERSNVAIAENAYVEKYSCARLASEVNSVEFLSQVQPCEPQLLNKEDISTGILLVNSTFGAERLNCSAKNCSDAAALVLDLTTSISLTEANASVIHQSIETGGPSPFNSIYILDIESEYSHLLESDGSELTPKKGPKGRENSMKHVNMNSFSLEEFGNSSIISQMNEDLSEFEDVKLEDDAKALKLEIDWDDIVRSEIALISSLTARKESSKTKLKKMFAARWRPSSRSRKLLASQEDLHSKAPSDFDWEIL